VIKMIEAYTKQKFWELINSIFRYRTECECDHPDCKVDHIFNIDNTSNNVSIQTVCEKYKDIETGKILMLCDECILPNHQREDPDPIRIADSLTFDLLPVLEIKL